MTDEITYDEEYTCPHCDGNLDYEDTEDDGEQKWEIYICNRCLRKFTFVYTYEFAQREEESI